MVRGVYGPVGRGWLSDIWIPDTATQEVLVKSHSYVLLAEETGAIFQITSR